MMRIEFGVGGAGSKSWWHARSRNWLPGWAACAAMLVGCGSYDGNSERTGAQREALTHPDSVDTDSTSGPLGAVGSFGFPQCTGTLVGRHLVVTAAHCLDCLARPTRDDTQGMSFQPGPLLSTSDPIGLAGWSPAPGSDSCGWSRQGGIPQSDIHTDLAVAVLHDDVSPNDSLDTVPVFLDDPKYLDKSSAVTVGMSTGFKQVQTVHPSGNWSESFSNGAPFNHGDSGGPLLMRDTRTGGQVLVGVISAQIGATGQWASAIGQQDFLADAIGIPASVRLADIAIMASTVKLNDRVRVARTALSGPNIAVAGSSVELGADARVEGNVFARSNVNLRSRAHVTGLVQTRGQVTTQQGAIVDGATVDGTFVKLPAVPASGPPIEIFNGAPDVVLEPGQSCGLLFGGIYNQVSLKPGSRCSLKAGSFFMRSLFVDSGAVLDVATGSTLPTVISTGSFGLRGTMNSSVNNFVLVIWGAQSSTFITTSFSGTLISFGAVSLAPATYFGAFFAGSIEIHQGATIAQAPTRTGLFD